MDSGKYIKQLQNHLAAKVTDPPRDVEVIPKFPDTYLPYPLESSTLVLDFKSIQLTSIKNPAGEMEIRIGIYTARDRGAIIHRDMLDKTLTALESFTGFNFATVKVGEAKFDRVTSSIFTDVICTVLLG